MQNLLSNLLIPLKAIVSRRFYYEIMFQFRGLGLVYLLLVCATIALPATVKVSQVFDSLKSLELGTLATQIPASYITKKGVLEAKSPTGEPSFIYNSRKELVIVYNPYDAPLYIDGNPINTKEVPITLTSHTLTLGSAKESLDVPWSALYGETGGDFEPLVAGQLIESTLNSSLYSIWVFVTVWLFLTLSLIVLIAALICKAVLILFIKMQMSLILLIRLSAFASTGVALIMCLQFFMNLAISFPVLCTIPIFYVLSFLIELKKHLVRTKEDPSYAQSPANPLAPWFDSKTLNFSAHKRPKRSFFQKPYLPDEDESLQSDTKETPAQDKEQAAPFQETSKEDDNVLSDNAPDVHKDGDGTFRP